VLYLISARTSHTEIVRLETARNRLITEKDVTANQLDHYIISETVFACAFTYCSIADGKVG
jgi:hypothetical protein